MAGNQTVFLMYHEIERPGRPTCRRDSGYLRYVVGEADFCAQVDHLREQGFQGLGVGAALGDRPADPRAVVFTFDDGAETDLLIAAPKLRKCGFKATSYVVAGYVGRPGFLTESQVRELAEMDIEIGSHSMTHPYFTDLDERRLRAELVEAKDRLEQLTGRCIVHLSCPGGRWDRRVARLAREAGYVSIATSRVRANPPTADRFRLARVAVRRGLGPTAFDRVCHGRGFWLRRLQDGVLATAKGVLGNTLYEKVHATLLNGI